MSLTRRDFIAGAAALAFAAAGSYAEGQAVPKNAIEKGPYAIVASQDTSAKWGNVVEALMEKHKGRASLFTYKSSPTEVQEQLAKLGPREIAYIGQLAEVKPDALKKVSALARSLDNDPYFDAVLGVITGLDDKDALKLVECGGIVPKTALLKTEKKFLNYFEDGWYYSEWHGGRSDGPGGAHSSIKAGKLTSEMKGYQNMVDEFYSYLKNYDVDVFVTAGNADHNIWECGMNDTKDGAFVVLPKKGGAGELVAIDAQKLAAYKAKKDPRKEKGDMWEFKEMDRPKIWYAPGDSAIGQIKNEDSMVPAAIRNMGVRQMWAAVRTIAPEEKRLGPSLQHYWGPGALDFPEAAFACQQHFIRSIEGRNLKVEPDGFVLYGDPAMPSRIPKPPVIAPPYRLIVRQLRNGNTATLEIKFGVLADTAFADPSRAEFLTRPIAVHADRIGEKHVKETSDESIGVWGNSSFTGLDFSKKGRLEKGYEARVVIEGKLQR